MSNEGKVVKVHYVGTFDDGTQFDSSVDRQIPLEFTCMAGQMIPGFDKAVNEMEVGETRKVRIPAADAYGEHDESLVHKVSLDMIPDSENLPVGQSIYLQGNNGEPIMVRVVAVADGFATFDMNSEMAGKDLNFEITLIEAEEY